MKEDQDFWNFKSPENFEIRRWGPSHLGSSVSRQPLLFGVGSHSRVFLLVHHYLRWLLSTYIQIQTKIHQQIPVQVVNKYRWSTNTNLVRLCTQFLALFHVEKFLLMFSNIWVFLSAFIEPFLTRQQGFTVLCGHGQEWAYAWTMSNGHGNWSFEHEHEQRSFEQKHEQWAWIQTYRKLHNRPPVIGEHCGVVVDVPEVKVNFAK